MSMGEVTPPLLPGPALRTADADDRSTEELLRAKAASGERVSVCLPARNEEATVGAVVATIVAALMEQVPLVDEVLVIDDGSTDATAAVAAEAGAVVVAADDVLPECGPGTGKGEALWKSLAASSGDVVVWCDADVRNFDARFVTGLLGPILCDPGVHFTKGFYRRPTEGATGGGRVTELVARPLLALLRPELSAFVQPLAGEYAGRRRVLEAVPFEQGYGVEVGLLADLADTIGLGAMAQVDLGTRVHRNRPLAELSPQAAAVMRAAMRRSQVPVPAATVLDLPGVGRHIVADGVRPPLVEVAGYARRAS
jgi:glucosyl-3-phosphoglycerate synthase